MLFIMGEGLPPASMLSTSCLIEDWSFNLASMFMQSDLAPIEASSLSEVRLFGSIVTDWFIGEDDPHAASTPFFSFKGSVCGTKISTLAWADYKVLTSKLSV